jgi:hypothetical protein
MVVPDAEVLVPVTGPACANGHPWRTPDDD